MQNSTNNTTQIIRLADVFIIGPTIIYAGIFTQLPVWLRYTLIGIGVATIIYNGNNYIKNRVTEK